MINLSIRSGNVLAVIYFPRILTIGVAAMREGEMSNFEKCLVGRIGEKLISL